MKISMCTLLFLMEVCAPLSASEFCWWQLFCFCLFAVSGWWPTAVQLADSPWRDRLCCGDWSTCWTRTATSDCRQGRLSTQNSARVISISSSKSFCKGDESTQKLGEPLQRAHEVAQEALQLKYKLLNKILYYCIYVTSAQIKSVGTYCQCPLILPPVLS